MYWSVVLHPLHMFISLFCYAFKVSTQNVLKPAYLHVCLMDHYGTLGLLIVSIFIKNLFVSCSFQFNLNYGICTKHASFVWNNLSVCYQVYTWKVHGIPSQWWMSADVLELHFSSHTHPHYICRVKLGDKFSFWGTLLHWQALISAPSICQLISSHQPPSRLLAAIRLGY